MCGITAVLSSSGAVSTEALHRGTAALHHRGPDGRGHWISPDCRVGLGHTRLSIIDLSTGAQPIANEDESLWIVANGEFYDFEQVRENLRRRGHSFRTGSDSEIALHLYEDLGPECLVQLFDGLDLNTWFKNATLELDRTESVPANHLLNLTNQGPR